MRHSEYRGKYRVKQVELKEFMFVTLSNLEKVDLSSENDFLSKQIMSDVKACLYLIITKLYDHFMIRSRGKDYHRL